MFKREHRFSFKTGTPKKKIVTPMFIVRYQESSAPKLAVVVGKRVSKKAVQRNRVKRIFTESLREELSKGKNNNDLVFFLRLPFSEYQKSAIINELQNLFNKLEVPKS